MSRIFDSFIFFGITGHQQSSKLIEAFECYVALSKEPLEDIALYQAQYNRLVALFSELADLGVKEAEQLNILKKMFLSQIKA
ncbi:hypothetical protein NYE24_04250 [Paenibacillus sp. FSL H7-0350]|uniref:hypothetical protein n=1 Tax=Paenibacillus sp. FSL H7-0350 TaxID=2975345 RepID=UPI0031596ABF